MRPTKGKINSSTHLSPTNPSTSDPLDEPLNQINYYRHIQKYQLDKLIHPCMWDPLKEKSTSPTIYYPSAHMIKTTLWKIHLIHLLFIFVPTYSHSIHNGPRTLQSTYPPIQVQFRLDLGCAQWSVFNSVFFSKNINLLKMYISVFLGKKYKYLVINNTQASIPDN